MGSPFPVPCGSEAAGALACEGGLWGGLEPREGPQYVDYIQDRVCRSNLLAYEGDTTQGKI